MATVINGAEGGLAGQDISAGTTGGASGNAFDSTNFSNVTCRVSFDNTHSAHGSMAYKVTLGATPGEAYAVWSTSLVGSAVSTIYARAYVYLDAVPGNLVTLFRWRSGSAVRGSVKIDTDASLKTVDPAGVLAGTVATTIPLNQWVRVEAKCIGNASTGVLECKLFTNLDDVTPTDSVSTSGLNTGGTIDAFRLGHTGATASNTTYWMDDVGASSVGYLGPVLASGSGTGTAYDATISVSGLTINADPGLASGSAYDATSYVTTAAAVNYSDNAVAQLLGNNLVFDDLVMWCQSIPFGYPSPPFYIKVGVGSSNFEVMLVTAGGGVIGDPWAIQRAQHGTTPSYHFPNERIEHGFGAKDVADIMSTLFKVGVIEPEGVISAPPNTYYLALNVRTKSWHGNVSGTFYLKVFGGSGPTGWVKQ